MSELKHLNLTEEDFDLLVEGLDSLPEKGAAGEVEAYNEIDAPPEQK